MVVISYTWVSRNSNKLLYAKAILAYKDLLACNYGY